MTNITYHLIINATAYSRNPDKNVNDLLSAFDRHGCKYKTYFTEYPYHERQLVIDIMEKESLRPWSNNEQNFPLLVIVGGDGTLHEAVNSLNNSDIPIGFIPSDNKSDFANAIDLSWKPNQIVEQLISVQHPTNLTTIHYDEKVSQSKGVCLNNFGIGFDADIDNYDNKIRQTSNRKFGITRFMRRIILIFKDFIAKSGFPTTIRIKGKMEDFPRTFLCTVTNVPGLSGGKVNIAPNANAKEDELDLIVIERQPWAQFLTIGFLLRHSKHFNSKFVHHYKEDDIRIISTVPQRAQFDGQVWHKQPYDMILTTGKQSFWIPETNKD